MKNNIHSQSAAILYGVIACLSLAALQAHASGNLLTDLDVNLGAKAEYTSNAFLNANEEEDTIFHATPSITAIREEGSFSAEASAGAHIKHYTDYSDNNSVNPFVELSGVYKGKPLSASAYASFVQTTDASDAIGNILETHTTSAGAHSDYYISSATGLSGGIDYAHKEARSLDFGETETWTFTGGSFYNYSPNLTLTLDLRYRTTEVDDVSGRPNDSEDIGLIAGATGQLRPNLTGEVAVGVQERSYDYSGQDNEVSPFLMLGTEWEVSSMTRVVLVGTYDYSTTVSNLSTESFIVSGTLEHDFTSDWTGNIGLAYEDSTLVKSNDSEDREDDQISYLAGLSYELSNWGSIGLQLSYADRSSNEDFYDYDAFNAILSFSSTF